MPLPKAIRRLTPDSLRHSNRLRGAALAAGLIPPRTMHTSFEAQLLAELAEGRHVAVEIGVYEGSSALVLCRALPREATLHLIDPFTEAGLAPGWRGDAVAAQRVVDRAVRRRRGPRVKWHVEPSADTARRWTEPVDLVFVDGDHSPEAARLDWELWHPFVRPGGVMIFHDARQGKPGGRGLPGDGGLPGPTSLVDELFRLPDALKGWCLLTERDTTVVVKRQPEG